MISYAGNNNEIYTTSIVVFIVFTPVVQCSWRRRLLVGTVGLLEMGVAPTEVGATPIQYAYLISLVE